MNDIFKIFLSLSVSGSLLILVLFLLKPLFRNRVSRQWQYYVWLMVIARLLLPIASDASLVGNLFRWSDQVLASPVPGIGYGGDESTRPTHQGNITIDDTILSQRGSRSGSGMSSQDGAISKTLAPTQDGNMSESAESLKESNESKAARPLQGGNALENIERSGWKTAKSVFGYLWMLWLAGILVLSVRKITAYQGYAKYIKAGGREVADIALLDQLAQEEVWAGVRYPVELYVNNLVSSPMLLGFFRPCIILPTTELPRDEFLCTVRHELIHYKRRDMFYKWLVQITICLHWFNPLVYLMGRELDRACELSCDEAVIRSLDEPGRRTYGDTLLHAVGTEERYGKTAVSVTLGESAKLLRERLDAIMKYQKMSKGGCCAVFLLSVALAFAFSALGAYAAESAAPKVIAEPENIPPLVEDGAEPEIEMETLELKGVTYYLVFNEEQLRAIGTGEYGMELNYLQQADIQLSEEEWVPIGTQEAPFTGSYNGNGYEITGLTMKNPDTEIVGMFGIAKNAHIYNITLRDYDIMGAGENVHGRSIAPILARGLGGVRSYDNFVYPRETGSASQVTAPFEDTLPVSWNALRWSAPTSQVTASSEDTLPISGKVPEESTEGNREEGKSDTLADKYYGINLPQFAAAFAMLDEVAQSAWLEKIYSDKEIAFFSASLQQLDVGSPLIALFAQKAYEDGKVSFFSVLADYMSKEALESWLDKAMQDRQVSFQLVLLKELDRDWELEALEEELERQRLAEYEGYGITRDGKAYYYQGQLVNIFLDHQSGSSFYLLDMNPNGAVNIKITRSEDGLIQSVDYMTEPEVEELFGDK